MDKVALLHILDEVTLAVEKVAPLIAVFGVPYAAEVGKFAGAAASVVQNAVDRAEEAQIVLTSQDVEEINAKIAQLEAVNAGLNDQIVAGP